MEITALMLRMLRTLLSGGVVLRPAAAPDAGAGGQLAVGGALRGGRVVVVAVAAGHHRVPAGAVHVDPAGRLQGGPRRPLAHHAGQADGLEPGAAHRLRRRSGPGSIRPHRAREYDAEETL